MLKRKLLCSLLAVALVFTNCTVFALDKNTNYPGLGTAFHSNDYQLANGLTLSTISATGSQNGSQRAQVVTFDPRSDVELRISCGNYVYGASTLSSMAKSEEERGNQVLYGINGGYFSYKTGIPLGMMISDGLITCSDAGQNALCINRDGSYLFGAPQIVTTLQNGTEQIKIDHINKYSSANGIYLLTDDFGTSTKSAAPSLEIVLRIQNGTLSHGSVITATVEKVLTDVTNSKIEPGTMVLSTSGVHTEKLKNLTPGSIVSVSALLPAGYENVVTAIGGGDLIVKDGKPGEFTQDSLLNVSNPMSAVGVLPTGKFVFLQADGRQTTYSKGLTAKEVSDLMISMGCLYAMNLDGGGPSTSVVTLPGNNKSELLNQPSNGNESLIGNGLLFINKNAKTAELSKYHIYPQSPIALRNSMIDFTVRGTSSSFHPVGLSGYPSLTTSVDGGSFSGYSYQAPDKAGVYPVRAALGGVSGAASVNVTDRVTDIYPNITNISMSPGGSVTLALQAYMNNILAYSTPRSFSWKINGDGSSDNQAMLVSNQFGTIDSKGVFTASGKVKSGSIIITASYGNVATNITVTIAEAKPALLLESYDSSVPLIKSFEGASATAYRSPTARYGAAGLQINYDFSNVPAAGNFYVVCNKPLPANVAALDIWSSAPSASAVVADKNGKLHEIAYTDVKTENGFHLLRASLPSNLAEPLTLVTPYKLYSDASAGTVFIDEVRAYFGEFSFQDVPETLWSKPFIDEVGYRGIMNGSVEEGILSFRPTANLTRADFAAVIANYLHLDLNSYKDVPLDYADTADIPLWAVPYVKAVTAEKLFGGSTEADGKLYFKGKSPIQRVEVMAVLSRLLKDTEAPDITLQFTDNASIPDWALPHVKKIVALKIIGGYPDGTLMPKKQMTRGEIAKVMATMK